MLANILAAVTGFGSRVRRRSVDQVVLREAAAREVLNSYRRDGPKSKVWPDVFCYTLSGRISGFEGFESQEEGTRTIIEGDQKRSHETAGRLVRSNRYDVVVADCLVEDPKQLYLHYLMQNLVCGIAARRVGNYKRDKVVTVSVVGANNQLLGDLGDAYGDYGLNFISGSRNLNEDTGKEIVHIGKTDPYAV